MVGDRRHGAIRIATYNLWNARHTWFQRLEAAAEEIGRVGADIVVLQEVRAMIGPSDRRSAAAYIAHTTGYRHVVFEAYPDDPDEGLAFLSRLPITRAEAGWQSSDQSAERALRLDIEVDGVPLAITNVHLDSSIVGILQRERQITAIIEWIAGRRASGGHEGHELLCGDFNVYPGSSIHTFLLGQASLLGHSTHWFDVAMYDAYRTGRPAPATLDFAHNPRWHSEHTVEIPARFDWILLRDCYPAPYPYVDQVELFGTEPTPRAQVVPSDHYGVFADIRLSSAVANAAS